MHLQAVAILRGLLHRAVAKLSILPVVLLGFLDLEAPVDLLGDGCPSCIATMRSASFFIVSGRLLSHDQLAVSRPLLNRT